MAVANGFDQDDRRCVILCGDDWHPGWSGIVASRMVERFGRPAILLEKTTCCGAPHVRLTGIRFMLGLSRPKGRMCKNLVADMAAGLSLAVDQFGSFYRCGFGTCTVHQP